MLSLMRPTVLYVATSNPGKLAEFATSASSSGIAVLPLPNLAQIPEPIEDAPTFRGNAELKARAYSLTLPNALVMADDSGLEVEALGGQPGVRSARFADDMAFELNTVLSKDARNNRCVLSLLAALPNPTRAARFTCELAVARDGKVLRNARGSVEGMLLTAPRGAAGFGYDPLFLLPALGRTMAELSAEEKWQLSHRGHAFRALLAQLQRQPL